MSLFVNLVLLALFFFSVKRDGLAVTFHHAGSFITAPLASIRWPEQKPRPVQKQVAPQQPQHPATLPWTAPAKPVEQVVRHYTPLVRELKDGKPKIIFVIDDMGHTLNDRDILRALGRDVTYAILPHLTYSRFYGLLSAETGAEVILHQPFEAKDGTIPGPGLITDRMSADQALNILSRSLASVPNHQGINNHMGSRGTSDPILMAPILKELKQRKLFFLDSMTSAKSVGIGLSKQLGLPAVKRDVFLDNVDDESAIRGQIRETASIARSKGFAIAIGHYHPKTLRVLRDEIPRLKSQGFEMVSLSEIIRYLQKKNAL